LGLACSSLQNDQPAMNKLFFFSLLVWSLSAAAQIKVREKVIFDCDLGDDIDDAYALAYLLTQQDRYEILGITTCYGRTEDRALLAQKMLESTGQEQIPVYAGRNTSNTSVRANWYADQFYWAKEYKPRNPLRDKKAADFIIEMLNRYPGEVTIFSVGPVTNFYDVLQKDSTLLKKARRIYAMFGSFYKGYDGSPTVNAEWNVVCDIAAAKAFVHCGAPIVYAGLDVTAMVKWEKASREKLLYRQSPLTNALSALYILWGNETPTLFDPVAIGMAQHPEWFRTEDVHVDVDEKGFTRIIAGAKPNGSIGTTIDHPSFLSFMLEQYLKQDLGPH
jgi:inosine-uridine nucleoside N-ribohydrolase